jgi:predicted metalloprotease with PDZ domain
MLRVVALLAVTIFAVAAVARADVPPPYELYGVGASMEDTQPFPKISNVAADSPAAQAGLKAGDGVIALDGAYAKGGVPFYFFAHGLTGRQDSKLEMIVLRNDREVLVLHMARSLRARR